VDTSPHLAIAAHRDTPDDHPCQAETSSTLSLLIILGPATNSTQINRVRAVHRPQRYEHESLDL